MPTFVITLSEVLTVAAIGFVIVLFVCSLIKHLSERAVFWFRKIVKRNGT